MSVRRPSADRAADLEREGALLALKGLPPTAPELKALDTSRLGELRGLAKGRCECTGECGQGHGYELDTPPRRCRAPHACEIVRRIASPGFWQLAPSLASGPLAYPEGFTRKQVMIDLLPVRIGDEVKVFCQRCRGLVLRNEAESAESGGDPEGASEAAP